MSEFRLLCPRCGQAFREGTPLARCPQCQVPLLSAEPLATADLPEQVDVDELLRQVLAEQESGEEIDAALRRVVQRDYPDAHEGLYRLLSQQLTTWQQLKGITRQEAAEELAAGESELKVPPEGTPELRTFQSQVHVEGLEHLSPEQREQVMKQVEDAIREGRPVKNVQFALGKGSGCSTAALAIGILAWLIWTLLE